MKLYSRVKELIVMCAKEKSISLLSTQMPVNMYKQIKYK